VHSRGVLSKVTTHTAEFWYYRPRATAPTQRQRVRCRALRLVVKDYQDVITTGSGIPRRELYEPVTRVRESPELLVRVSRWLKIARCKSALGDSKGLVLGQLPIGAFCGAAGERYNDNEREDTQHRSNEKETSHGRGRWQTR
jgi:hypothetical protein